MALICQKGRELNSYLPEGKGTEPAILRPFWLYDLCFYYKELLGRSQILPCVCRAGEGKSGGAYMILRQVLWTEGLGGTDPEFPPSYV